MARQNKSVHLITLQQIQNVYWSGLNIGIGFLQENSINRKIRESLLWRAGVGRCPGLSNWCTFWLANKQSGKYIYDNELELNRFQTLPLGELVWHLSIQVKNSDPAAYINVFDPRRDKRRRFITFMVYDLVYLSIASNLVTLDALSPWSDYVCTHPWYPL